MELLSILCGLAAASVALGAVDPALERRWRAVALYLIVAGGLGAAACGLWPAAS